MKSRASLEEFLIRAEAEGFEKENLGFTLDQQRAASKLGASQLPDPALWIVKMLQAAVAGEASEFDVIFSRKKVQVSFDWELKYTARELLDLVVSGALPKEPSLLHLLTGIRACFARAGSMFLLQSLGPEGRDIVTLSREDSKHYSDQEGPTESRNLTFVVHRPHRMLTLSNSLTKPVLGLLKGSADEHLSLLERCWCSPIRITIDNRPMHTGYDSPLIHWRRLSLGDLLPKKSNAEEVPRCTIFRRYSDPVEGEPNLKVAADGEARGEGPVLVTDQGELRMAKWVHLDESFLDWIPTQDRARRVLAYLHGHGRDSHLFFVMDGALIERVRFWYRDPRKKILGIQTTPSQASGFYCTEPIGLEDTDLSQFSVPDLEKRREELIRELRQPLREASEFALIRMDSLSYLPVKPNRIKLAKVVMGALALTAVVSAGPFVLLPGMATGIVGVMSYENISSKRAMVKANLQKALEELNEFDADTVEQPPIERLLKS